MCIYLDFEKTAFYPIVVHHPYTTSGVTALHSSEDTEIVNLLEDKAGLAKWRHQLKQKIDAAESVIDIYDFITKPYSLSFIDLAQNHLSKADLSRLLRNAWMHAEFLYNNPVFSRAQFAELFRKCEPSILMTPEECAAFSALPNEIELYRGVRKCSKKIRGMSWTTSLETAEFFSKRFSEGHSRGDLYKAQIRKSDILAYFLERGEQEIVVDTRGLRNIEKLNTPSLDIQPKKQTLESAVRSAASRVEKPAHDSEDKIFDHQR